MQVVISNSNKSAFGAPLSEVVADLTGLLTSDGVAFTTATLWGPLEATIRFVGTTSDAYNAAEHWLGDPLTVYDDDGGWCWEGRIWTVTYGSGNRRRSRSLEGYANTCRVVYDNINPATVPPTVIAADQVVTGAPSDTDGLLTYGRIDYISIQGQLTTVQAQAMADRNLADRHRIPYLPTSGTLGEVSTSDEGVIEIYCVGWWHTLMDRGNHIVNTAGTADVSTIIQAALTAITGQSPFVVLDFSQMALTGTIAAQQFHAHESVGVIVKRLIASASGFTFGLGPGRVPYIRPDGRADAAVTYIELTDGQIQDASGGSVPLWSIRPGCILRQADMVPAEAGLSATAIDGIENVYLSETTFTTPGTLAYKTSVAGVNGEVLPL